MTVTRTCRSGKRRYHDQEEAKDALTRIRQNGEQRDVMPVRVYVCDGPEGCFGWHITSKESGYDRPEVLKRTGLKRGTEGLKRGTDLKRGKRLKPRSDKRASQEEAEERARVRGEVYLRDGFRCQIAPLVPDVSCFGHLTPHHLRKASQGGAYTVENLMSACERHNDWVEENPTRAKALGLVLR